MFWYFDLPPPPPSVHYDDDGRTDGNTGINIIIVSIIKKTTKSNVNVMTFLWCYSECIRPCFGLNNRDMIKPYFFFCGYYYFLKGNIVLNGLSCEKIIIKKSTKIKAQHLNISLTNFMGTVRSWMSGRVGLLFYFSSIRSSRIVQNWFLNIEHTKRWLGPLHNCEPE